MYGGNIPLERYDKCQLKDDWLGKERDMIRIKWIKMWIADCRKPHWIAVQCISFWDVKRYDKCQLEDDWLEKERERRRQAAKRSWKRRLGDTWWRAAVIRLNTSENKVALENLGRESYSDKGISHILREIFLNFVQRISQTLWHLMTRLKWFG